MAADSSCVNTKDSFFLKSWGSCETLGAEESDTFCAICKDSLGKVEDNIDLEEVISKTAGGCAFIYKSVIYLTCVGCPSVTHIHCACNTKEVEKDIVVEYLLEDKYYTCYNCSRDGASTEG